MTNHTQSIGPSPFGPSQTIVQLHHELAARGFTAQELRLLARAHEHVTKLFAGQLRSSGRPFTCHTVGTASIVANHGGSLTEIAAGLLHATYEFGDTGAHVPSAGRKSRERIIELAGKDVEAVIFAFYRTGWPELIARTADMGMLVSECGPEERSALFVRVCNEIEQLPDLPFCSPTVRARCLARRECLLAIADSLGRTDLFQLYDEGHRLVTEASEAIEPIGYPYLVAPASYTKRLNARIREFAFNNFGSKRATSSAPIADL